MEKIKGEANFKNGFQIIITNLDNGEELLNEKSNAIIGAISEENRNRGIAFTACNAYTLISVVGVAKEVIEDTKKELINQVIDAMGDK
ncbi:MAG: hypothetical protein J6V66_00640 [Clostridia bacterium]|nr:hypothetical protein [Clostridia bacterium]